jgi:hypothetical protein
LVCMNRIQRQREAECLAAAGFAASQHISACEGAEKGLFWIGKGLRMAHAVSASMSGWPTPRSAPIHDVCRREKC